MRVWINRICIMFALAVVFVPLLSCAHPDMGRVMLVPGACERPRLPLSVAFDPENSDMATAFMDAGQAWADALGFPAVFRLATEFEDGQADVYVTAGPAPFPTWVANTAAYCRGNWFHQVVTFHRPLDGIEAHLYSVHEIGHVLGLDHSRNQNSVMFPTLDADLMGDWDTQGVYWIQQSDVSVVLALYAILDR